MEDKRLSILFDHQIFESQRFGGISRYFTEVIKRIPDDSTLSLRISANHYLKHNPEIKFPGVFMHHLPFKWLRGPIKSINASHTKKMLEEGKFDLFHPTYYHPQFLDFIGNKPYILTVHDMNHEIFSELDHADIMIQWKKKLIDKAQRIIAISENTRNDLINLLGVKEDKIDVIYHGINKSEYTFTDQEADELLRELALPDRYVLYVGGRNEYKNFDRFSKAFSLIAKKEDDIHLVCTGRSFSKREKEALSKLGILERCINLQVDDSQLGPLYHNALMFVYPSLYEGFGIPILEAYASGCPVALSHASCFPEIAGEAALYFDPMSVEDIKDKMELLLNDSALRRTLIDKGKERVDIFTWEETAHKTHLSYQKCL